MIDCKSFVTVVKHQELGGMSHIGAKLREVLVVLWPRSGQMLLAVGEARRAKPTVQVRRRPLAASAVSELVERIDHVSLFL